MGRLGRGGGGGCSVRWRVFWREGKGVMMEDPALDLSSLGPPALLSTFALSTIKINML